MYKFTWDEETGGILLLPEQAKISLEPRPVYHRELNLLGFNQYWIYPQNDKAPIMWAINSNYYYRGRMIAKVKGGSLYNKPELQVLDSSDKTLIPIDMPLMLARNKDLLETLVQETIKNVYNTYKKYHKKLDIFYVAFSGGKDSIVALNIVQKSLPHDAFSVLFGDTQMEFPDTYNVVTNVQRNLKELGINFYRVTAPVSPMKSWYQFGPPSTSIRWCCSVHKTSPQINFIRKLLNKNNFSGMAFTGVRAEESVKRSEYTRLSKGKKHVGQYSFHTILDWGSAEVFLYIFTYSLIMNEAYKKGNARAGCLVCPNSTGRNEYVKHANYKKQVDQFVDIIFKTSGKRDFSDTQLKKFIDDGLWRTRKSGKELNFGQDKFDVSDDENGLIIKVYDNVVDFKEWIKTIGQITFESPNIYKINFQNDIYNIVVDIYEDKTVFKINNKYNTKNYIKFKSLFKSVIIKSIYCVRCGECEAECKTHCISMNDNSVKILDDCLHCFKCHDIRDHCMRYSSIRNKVKDDKKMSGIDRYFTFGVREDWLDCFLKYNGDENFWLNDGDGKVNSKKKDAFLHFIKDANIVEYNRKADGDKYTKNKLTVFGENIVKIKNEKNRMWALIAVNLCYTPMFSWIINNMQKDVRYSAEELKILLSEAMPNDTKGLGRRNVVDSIKIIFSKTPLGQDNVLGYADVDIKENASGSETIKLKSISRCSWVNPDELVILYSLYKFAEACGGMYQFNLSTLLDDTIEREGVSPTRIFGIDRETMIPILNGLSANYPAFISASFNLDLENISLREDKKAEDVLALL